MDSVSFGDFQDAELNAPGAWFAHIPSAAQFPIKPQAGAIE